MVTATDRGFTRIGSEEDAHALASRLVSDVRTKPIVLISVAAGQQHPYVDVDEVVQALGDLAEVYVFPTGEVSWAFADAMPAMTQVYGGASRVYPVGLGWTTDPPRSPLRLAFGTKDGKRVTELLISDAMGMALAAGLLNAPTRRALVRAGGTVIGVVGGRALVSTDHGPATIWPELTVRDVEADRLFTKGMSVEGAFDVDQRRLDVRESLLPAEALLAAYQPDSTVLGRVTRVDAGGCHVELVPGVRVFVDAREASADPQVRLTGLMTVGETVRARVARVGERDGKGWRLSLVDVDLEAEPYAASLLASGPPWLALPVRADTLEDEEPAVTEVAPPPAAPSAEATGQEAPDAGLATALRAERDGFLAELEAAKAQLARVERSREHLRTQTRDAVNEADRRRREIQALRDQLSRAANDSELFLDPAEQLDFDIRLAWARRTPPAEKPALRLGRYVLGPQFLDSLEAVDGVDRQKVVDVIVEILTGRVHDLRGRESHQLRTSESGNADFVTRPDGATCWRVALQVKAPQARRLHYWQLSNGLVELSSVRQHDDYRP